MNAVMQHYWISVHNTVLQCYAICFCRDQCTFSHRLGWKLYFIIFNKADFIVL